MSTVRLQAHPTINYIWIGPPTSDSKNQVTRLLEHDVMGPRLMADQNKDNPIRFWCLKKYLPYYEKYFESKSNIQVLCVEDYLDKIIKTGVAKDSELASIVTKNMQILLSDRRGQVRDFVTVKEMLSLFILTIEGGYTLDTNIKPLTKNKVVLPHYEKFQLPLIRSITDHIDCWMMYAPKNNEVANKILHTFLKNWLDTEALFEKVNYVKEYHEKMGDLIINAIEEYAKPTECQNIYFNDSKIVYLVKMKELNLVKTYYNTHAFSANTATKKTGIIYWAIMYQDIDFLSEMLTKGLDINYKVADETLLEHALGIKAKQVVDLLIDKGAKLSSADLDKLLLTSIQNDDYGIFEYTLNKLKIDINHTIEGKSLLQHAIRSKSVIAEYLRELGAKKPESKCRLFCSSKKTTKEVDNKPSTKCVIL